MQKIRLLGIAVLVIAASLLFPRPAYAYIDAGSAMLIFAILAPVFIVLLAALAFTVRLGAIILG